MSKEHWDNVLALLDTIDNRDDTRFAARGTILHENWGNAFEQIVHMMYWVDVISHYNYGFISISKKNRPVSNDERLRSIATSLITDINHIRSIMEKDAEYNALMEKE